MKGQRDAVVCLDRVSKSFGSVRALMDVDLEVRAGEVLAVLGPNGAGKTTSINLMVGLLKPDQGSVRVFGKAPDSHQARIRTGVMLQVSGVPETLRVREHVAQFSRYYLNPLPVDQVLSLAGLEEVANRPYGKLSGGQKRRLQFGLAICGRPDLIFLDEPTVGLDVESRRTFWSLIRELVEGGTSVVLTTHYLEEADALADRIVVIDRGSVIAEGTPDAIKARARGKRIRCRTLLSSNTLQTLPGVTSVVERAPMVEILTSETETTARALLAADASLTDLEIHGAKLEEAFLHLTNQEEAPLKEAV